MSQSPTHFATVAQLLELIHGGWTSQAVCAAVELGIADGLQDGGLTVSQLATRLPCDADALLRLLRALASLDIVAEGAGGVFVLTALGQCLRSDVPDSLHAQAQAQWFGRYSWPLWGQLSDSVRSGLSGRQRLPEHYGYSHLQADPEAAAVFNLAMAQLTRLVAAAVATACDFSEAEHFVDVGGGYGELLVACMLRARSDAKGILMEMAHAVAGAQRHLQNAGLAARAEAQEGDFFVAIPAGADVYLLKAVLHNWDDARCDVILANVRCAMAPHARLVVVERVLPERMAPTAAHRAVARSDLNMLVGLGGRERTQGELTALLRAAGFPQPSFKPAAAGFYAIEASGR
jgi:hypothetical protein